MGAMKRELSIADILAIAVAWLAEKALWVMGALFLVAVLVKAVEF